MVLLTTKRDETLSIKLYHANSGKIELQTILDMHQQEKMHFRSNVTW